MPSGDHAQPLVMNCQFQGSRPSQNPSQDNVVFLVDGKVISEIPIIIGQVDLLIDSNNDGVADSSDQGLNMQEPGKLIYLNQDDDDQKVGNDNRDIPDLQKVLDPVINEDDLAPVTLELSPALDPVKAKVVLDVGSTSVKIWKSATKGKNNLIGPSDKSAEIVGASLPWILENGSHKATLYIEGVLPGRLQLRLAYVNGVDTIEQYPAKAGVVSIAFAGRVGSDNPTVFGFDAGDTDRARPAPNSTNCSQIKTKTCTPQRYDWVAVRDNTIISGWENKTYVDLNVTPSEYSQYVHLKADDPFKFSISPTEAVPNKSNQSLEITGATAGLGYVQAYFSKNSGTTLGAKGNRLNVAVLPLLSRTSECCRAAMGPTGSDWTPKLSLQNIEDSARPYLTPAVVGMQLSDSGLMVDPNSGAWDRPPIGQLDIDRRMSNGGPEFAAFMDYVANYLNSTMPHARPVIVLVKDLFVHTQDPLPIQYPGFSDSTRSFIVINDSYRVSDSYTLPHEYLHILGLRDVGPEYSNIYNVMYYHQATANDIKPVGFFMIQAVTTDKGYPVKQGDAEWDPDYQDLDPQWTKIRNWR